MTFHGPESVIRKRAELRDKEESEARDRRLAARMAELEEKLARDQHEKRLSTRILRALKIG